MRFAKKLPKYGTSFNFFALHLRAAVFFMKCPIGMLCLIISLTGQLLEEKRFPESPQRISLDLRLQPGLYLLEVLDNNVAHRLRWEVE